MSDAVLRERGYTAYEGPRHPERAVGVLAAHTARALWSGRGTRRALLAAFVPALITAVVIYVESRVGGASVGAARPLALFSHAYGVIFPALVVALAAAGGTLAEDRRANALSFYFARPLPPRDYLVGRLLGTIAALSVAIVAPSTLVAIFRLALVSDAVSALSALGIVALTAALGLAMAALLSIYALLGGALASSRGAAQSFVGLAFLLPWMAAGVGERVLDGPWLSLLSLPALMDSIAHPFLPAPNEVSRVMSGMIEAAGAGAEARLPAWAALLALGFLCTAGLLVLRQRVEQLGSAGGGDT